MRVIVDLEACQDHGQCVFAAPEVFALGPDGELSFRRESSGRLHHADFDDSLRDVVEEAADVCPLQAIRVED